MIKGIIGILLMVLGLQNFAQQPFKHTLKLMGCRFDITVVAHNQTEANTYTNLAVAEITRIENYR